MKMYEKPMVELTKFNSEDIIATSTYSTKDKEWAATAMKDAMKAGTVKASDGVAYDDVEIFNW